MTTEINAAPAGDGASAPASAAAPQGPLNVHAAAGLLADWDDEPEAPAESPDPSNPPTDPETAAAEAPESEETAEQAAPAEEAEPESEPEAEQIVHGNAKTRLRDGTVVAVADLKKAFDELKDLRAKEPELTATQQQLQARAAQLAQQQQLFQQVLPLVLQKAQAAIPAEPDPRLLASDPIAHYEQTVARNNAIAEYRKLEAAQAAHTQQLAKAQEEQFKSYLTEQQRQLADKLPDIRVPEKRAQIYKGFVDTASKYGFSRDEVDNVHDHRLLHMVHELSAKAAKYDQIQAAKPKVQEKAKAAVPVATPQRRVSPDETRNQAREDQIQRLRSRGGRVDDAAALLAEF